MQCISNNKFSNVRKPRCVSKTINVKFNGYKVMLYMSEMYRTAPTGECEGVATFVASNLQRATVETSNLPESARG